MQTNYSINKHKCPVTTYIDTTMPTAMHGHHLVNHLVITNCGHIVEAFDISKHSASSRCPECNKKIKKLTPCNTLNKIVGDYNALQRSIINIREGMMSLTACPATYEESALDKSIRLKQEAELRQRQQIQEQRQRCKREIIDNFKSFLFPNSHTGANRKSLAILYKPNNSLEDSAEAAQQWWKNYDDINMLCSEIEGECDMEIDREYSVPYGNRVHLYARWKKEE